jgi:hypothetical protein
VSSHARGFDDVLVVLECEGVEKFEQSWHELVDTIEPARDGQFSSKVRPDAVPGGCSHPTRPASSPPRYDGGDR